MPVGMVGAQGFQYGNVAVIDIPIEADVAAGVRIDGPIEKQDRQRLWQIDPRGGFAIDNLRHPGGRPILLFRKQLSGQLERVFDPDTA